MNRPDFLLWPLQMVLLCGSFKMFLESPYFWEIQNCTINSWKIVPLCNYIHLPVTVKLLVTFLEAILWKRIQPFRCILNYVGRITKTPSLQCWFLSREVEPGQKIMADAPVLSDCYFWRNPWPKPTGVLEHCCEGETNFSSFLGCFVLTSSQRWQGTLMYISLLTFIIPQVLCQQICVNYTC
jgi:hypothetical protein